MIPKPLQFYLNEIKNITSDEFILREATPFNVLLSSIVNKNIQTASEVDHYLETLKFPTGCSSKQISKRKKETYLPLVNINVSSENISSELDIFTKEIYELLNAHCENLKPCIEIALMEIFNNIRSHSKAKNVKYLAQRWFDEHLEFVIYDDGVGFKETLQSPSESDALEKAVYKKQSCTGDENRGWGIQTLKALVLNNQIKGEFLIISNDTYSYISNRYNQIKKDEGSFDFNIKGSMVILRLNYLSKANFENIYGMMLEPDKFVQENNLLN